MIFEHDLSPESRTTLDELYFQFVELKRRVTGYPCTQTFYYSELFRFLQFSINNIGDPYAGSIFGLNTHNFEREVAQNFATLTHALEGNYWGYVTNGGTESNTYGLYPVRELHPEGVVYFSEDTHYSVAKILRVLHTRNIMIKSQGNGELDYNDLRETIRLHRDTIPIIFANIGTTMKGAVDNIFAIKYITQDLAIQQYYIHCDAARELVKDVAVS